MAARWFSLVIWAVVAASAMAWGLKLFVRSQPTPLHAVTVDTAVAVRGDLTRLFGAHAAVSPGAVPVAADARFKLLGVVASRAPLADAEGLALIAVDGKPPRAYRVGHVIEGDTVLQAVRARGVSLGPRGGAAAVALEIPPLPAAATGPAPGTPVAPSAAGPMPAPPPMLPQPGPVPQMPQQAAPPQPEPPPAAPQVSPSGLPQS
jgi:general secretion pathway protein C